MEMPERCLRLRLLNEEAVALRGFAAHVVGCSLSVWLNKMM